MVPGPYISSFGTFFSFNNETLQMPTVHSQEAIDTTASGFTGIPQPPATSDQERKSRIREFISWSVCFAIVGGLTGFMKFMKIGVTMESVTSILFYLSVAGLIFFIFRIVLLSKNPANLKVNNLHELN